MADFSKFKIGNTSYNVKDTAAGKSLSISGKDLSLKNAAGTAVSTVTLPDDTIYAVEVRYTDNTITGQASDAVTAMKAGTGTWSVTITPALPAGKTLADVNRVFTGYCSFPNADPGYTDYMLHNTSTNNNYVMFGVEDDNLTHNIGALLTVFVYSDGSSVMEWGWTDLSSGGGGGSANTNIAFIAQTSGWPTLNTIYYIPGNYKLTNQIGIKATGYGQYGPTETSILASAISIDDTYASVEDFLAHSPAQGNTFKIVAWFIANVNTIAKVTATCVYDGNGGYTINSASATSASNVGQ